FFFSNISFGSKTLGNNIDHSTHRLTTIDSRRSTFQNFNTINFSRSYWNITIKMSRIRIIESYSIENNKHLFKCSSPQNNIRLRYLHATGLHFYSGNIAKQFINRMNGQLIELITRNTHDISSSFRYGCSM